MPKNHNGLFTKLFLSFFIATLFLFIPSKKAEAQYVDVVQAPKETFGDFAAYTISQILLKKITAKTVNWINSGFQGNPSYVTDPGQFFLDVGDEAASSFLSSRNLNRLCEPFRAEIRLALVKNYLSETSNENYACTLNKLKTNYENFVNDFSEGGWEGWFEITQNSENNPYGSYLNAKQSLSVQVSGAGEQKKTQLTQSGGFLSYERCKPEWVVKPSDYIPFLNQADGGQDYKVGDCRKNPAAREVVTPGSIINNQLSKSLGSSWERLGAADEITEIVSALVAQLIEKVVGGSGNGGLRGVSQPGSGTGNSFLDDYLNDPQPQPINIPTRDPEDTFTCLTDPVTGVMRCKLGSEVPSATGGQCADTGNVYASDLDSAMSEVLDENPDMADLPNIETGGRQNARKFLSLVEAKLISKGFNATNDVLNGNNNPNTGDLIAVWKDGDEYMERYDAINGAAGTIGQAPQTNFVGFVPMDCTRSGGGKDCGCRTTTGGVDGGNGTSSCSFNPSSYGNDPGAPLTIDPSRVIFEEGDSVGSWPETARLESFRVDKINIYMPFDKADSWPSTYLDRAATIGNPWIVIWRDGAWRARTFSWIRPGQTIKEATEDIFFGGGGGAQTFGNFRPVAGERYGFMVSGVARDMRINNIKERSNIVIYTWPAGISPGCVASGNGESTGENGQGPVANPTPGTAFISSVSPSSAKPGVTNITISGTNLTNQVSFYNGDGGRETVTGVVNSTKTQTTVLVPASIPIGNATVKIYQGNSIWSNGKLISISNDGGTRITTITPSSFFVPTGIEYIGYLGRTYNNGWWPSLSPNGRYVAFGNWGDSYVIDLESTTTPPQKWNFKNPEGLVSGGKCMAGQWMSNTKLTFVCEISTNSFWRYEVTVGEWIPRKTNDDPNLVLGSMFRVADNNWATFVPNRVVKNNNLLASNSGGAISLSGNTLVRACTNENSSICVHQGTSLSKTYTVKTPMFMTAVENNYIAYGGYGPVRGITPTGTDVDLTVSPWRWENVEDLVTVNGTVWVMTSSFDNSTGGSYLFLRPWGSKSVIAISAPAVWARVVVKGTDFIIAYNDDQGNIKIITVPIGSTRTTLN